MEFHEQPLAGPLATFIEAVWTLKIEAPDCPAEEPVTPDGRSEIILHLGDPYERKHADAWNRQPTVLVAGQIDQPLYLRPTGRSSVLGFRIRPGCARALLDVPQSELLNLTIDPVTFSTPLAGTIRGAAAESTAHGAKAQAICAGLLRLVRPDRLDHRVLHAVRRLDSGADLTPITKLARELDISTRHLERLFLEHVGLSPKVFQRIRRLRRALSLLDQSSSRTLAQIAARAGYSDQAHFVRDCRAFSGLTPTNLAEEEHSLTTLLLRGDRSSPR